MLIALFKDRHDNRVGRGTTDIAYGARFVTVSEDIQQNRICHTMRTLYTELNVGPGNKNSHMLIALSKERHGNNVGYHMRDIARTSETFSISS